MLRSTLLSRLLPIVRRPWARNAQWCRFRTVNGKIVCLVLVRRTYPLKCLEQTHDQSEWPDLWSLIDSECENPVHSDVGHPWLRGALEQSAIYPLHPARWHTDVVHGRSDIDTTTRIEEASNDAAVDATEGSVTDGMNRRVDDMGVFVSRSHQI